MTLATDEVTAHLHSLVTLTSHWVGGRVSPKAGVRCGEKSVACAENRTPASQSVARSYTELAILPLTNEPYINVLHRTYHIEIKKDDLTQHLPTSPAVETRKF
jgi:hypothetical protein